MPRIEASIVTARPVDDVFQFTDNPASEPIWQASTGESTYTTDGPVGVGKRGQSIITALGRRVVCDRQVTEYQPARRVSARRIPESYPFKQT